ncbi:MAG: hypothetical protein DCC69_12675 [Hyphomicrobiales bacterium]|nr:MAG: hypothetical protein DCC69_12675 [Hyphomicrobiales bacterium]
MKPNISETSRTEKRVELWTPWGVLRLTRSQEAARKRREPLPGAWVPPVAARPAREQDFEPRA